MEILKQRSINPKRVDIMINSYCSKTKRMEVDIKITHLSTPTWRPQVQSTHNPLYTNKSKEEDWVQGIHASF